MLRPAANGTSRPNPDVPEPGDAELVRLAQSAPGAFAPLYLRYRDAVLNYCYYRLGNQHDAEDAAGTVFVKALGNPPRFSARKAAPCRARISPTVSPMSS